MFTRTGATNSTMLLGGIYSMSWRLFLLIHWLNESSAMPFPMQADMANRHIPGEKPFSGYWYGSIYRVLTIGKWEVSNMAKNLGNSDDAHWRDRYYDSLKIIETKEDEWGQIHKLVSSVLVHLSLVVADQHSSLDNNLTTLREALRKDVGLLELRPLFNDLTKQLIQLYEENHKGQSSTGQRQDGPDFESVRTRMASMLNGLDIPTAYRERLVSIKHILHDNDNDSFASIIKTLETYTEVLVDIYHSIKTEQEKLEHYLQQLTVQLSDLDSDVSATEDLRLNVQRSSNEVDIAVHSEVNEMENSITKELGVENLKEVVQHRLVAIREHMASFRKREEKYNEEASRLIGRLSKRLYLMEKEADRLRIQIYEKHKQSLSDTLTGLPNRKAYDEYIERELKFFAKKRKPLTLLIIDIDYFKKVNDKFGHVTGDNILKRLADVLSEAIRDGDFLARYGGEEFAIIMTNTQLKQAEEIAERLRKAVQHHHFNHKNKRIELTISGGLAQMRKTDTLESLFERADNALYVAKESGRNRIEPE